MTETQEGGKEIGEMTMEDITVAEMTASQLKALVQSAVKEALREALGDPDAGLALRPEFEERLRQAVTYVASDGHLLSMEELVDQPSRSQPNEHPIIAYLPNPSQWELDWRTRREK